MVNLIWVKNNKINHAGLPGKNETIKTSETSVQNVFIFFFLHLQFLTALVLSLYSQFYPLKGTKKY